MIEIGPKQFQYDHELRIGKFTAGFELGTGPTERFGLYLRIGFHHERFGTYRLFLGATEPHRINTREGSLGQRIPVEPRISNGYLEAEIIWRNRAIFSKRHTVTQLPFIGAP